MKTATRISLLFLVLGVLAPAAWAQQASVSGVVTDAVDGQPLPGANVVFAGTSQGTAADFDGRYRIDGVAPGSYTLRFSFTGYKDQEIALTLAPGENRTLDVALQSGLDLDPVVITASRKQE